MVGGRSQQRKLRQIRPLCRLRAARERRKNVPLAPPPLNRDGCITAPGKGPVLADEEPFPKNRTFFRIRTGLSVHEKIPFGSKGSDPPFTGLKADVRNSLFFCQARCGDLRTF